MSSKKFCHGCKRAFGTAAYWNCFATDSNKVIWQKQKNLCRCKNRMLSDIVSFLPRVQKWGFLVCASNCPRGKSRIRLDSTGYKPSCGFCHGGKGLFKKRVRFWVDHGRAWVAAYWFCHGCKLPSLHFCHGFKIFLGSVFATRSTTLLYRWQISSPNG